MCDVNHCQCGQRSVKFLGEIIDESDTEDEPTNVYGSHPQETVKCGLDKPEQQHPTRTTKFAFAGANTFPD